MLRKLRAPRDEGLQQIAEWQQWFLGAQLDVIAANPDMHDAERVTAIAEAERLSAAIGERMRVDYLLWKNRVV